MNKKNGNVDILDNQQQRMRETVVDLELKARYWKAQYEIKQYTLLGRDVEEDYNTYVKAEQEKAEKAQAEFMEQLEKMKGQEGVEVTQTLEETANA